MDYTRYFDKNPTTSYCLGPSGSGILQSQPFGVEWKGWFIPNSGLFYQKATEFGSGVPYFRSDTSSPLASSFSFSFDTGNRVWYSTETSNSIKIVGLSGLTYTFSGKSPQLYNNSVLAPRSNDTICFYLQDDASISFRSSRDSFASARTYISGLNSLNALTQVRKLEPPHYYRFGIYGLDDNADAFMFISRKHNSIETGFFQNFESLPSGLITGLPKFATEENYSSLFNFTEFSFDNMDEYPSGQFYSGSIYTFNSSVFQFEDYEDYPTGQFSSDDIYQWTLFHFDDLEEYPSGIFIGSDNIILINS